MTEIVKRVILGSKQTDVTGRSNQTNNASIPLVNLGVPELFAEAERQFAFHPLKKDILIELCTVLPQVVKSNSYAHGRSCVYNTQEEAQKQHAIEDALESFFYRKDIFKNLETIRYGGLVLDREKMKHQILEQAEIFIKSIEPKENQKDVLNYIRQIAYDRNFLKDPIAFINKWIQDRRNEKIHRFPSDDALSFFKKIML